MKKTMVIVVLALVLAGLMASNCFATAAWYTCTLTAAGSGGTSPSVQLTDTAATPAFTNKYFALSGTNASQLLAISLTALSNGSKVMAWIDPSVSGYTISILYGLNN